MANCFHNKYAHYYDLIYKDKSYEKECNYLERIFRRFLKKKPRNILDLACGTGGHIIPLTKRNYNVVGIDTSKAMIDIAKKKAKSDNLKIKYFVDTMQGFKINKKFDVIIIMFSAIDYLTDHVSLKKALINIKKHLKKEGLFIFDFWNGFAVINDYDAKKIKIIKKADTIIKRISLTKVDLFKHIAKVKFKCSIFRKAKLIDRTKEMHHLRFFFPEEIKGYLRLVGFKTVEMYRFLTFNKEISNKDWDITVIARRI